MGEWKLFITFQIDFVCLPHWNGHGVAALFLSTLGRIEFQTPLFLVPSISLSLVRSHLPAFHFSFIFIFKTKQKKTTTTTKTECTIPRMHFIWFYCLNYNFTTINSISHSNNTEVVEKEEMNYTHTHMYNNRISNRKIKRLKEKWEREKKEPTKSINSHWQTHLVAVLL